MLRLLEIYQNLSKPSMKWNTYFPVFETHLSKYIATKPKVLEIGVAGGGSLELWSNFFVNGEIHGIDSRPEILDYQYNQANIYCHQGDQGDPKFWDNFIGTQNKTFDVIIDDGSHVNRDQALTLIKLFPHLNHGGTYIIEDTHTSYWSKYGGGLSQPGSLIENTKSLIDQLHYQHLEEKNISSDMLDIFKDIYSVTYYNSMVVITKEPYVEMKQLGNLKKFSV